MRAIMKTGMFFAWMLWAAAAFTGCHAVITMDADSGYDTGGDTNAPGNNGVLTLTGAESGTRYEVTLFPYSSSAEKSAEAWREATINPSAGGTATASSGSAAITLKTPSGAGFNSTGTYFVLVSKSSGGESRYKAVVFRSGNAAIDLASTLALPGTPASSGISLSAPPLYPFLPATAGYTERQHLEVTVSNTGNAPTGILTITLGGTDGGAFILNRTSIADIAAGRTESFTVMPRLGLTAPDGIKEYIATVTVRGNADIGTRDFEVSFTVSPGLTYGISLSTDRLTFPSMPESMTPPSLGVTVTNTGNQSTGNLTVTLSGASASSFTVSPGTIPGIPAKGTTAFTVTPKSGLSKGTYKATVTVRGGANIGERALTVSFKVVDAPVEGSEIVISPAGSVYKETVDTAYIPTYYSISVTIRNIGSVKTSDLTVTLSPTNASALFTVSPAAIPGIPAGGEAEFTVTPKGELPAGTYKAAVTVDGDNIKEPQTLDITFKVSPDPEYGISLNAGMTDVYDMGMAEVGYTAEDYQLNVTVINSGNQPTGNLTVSLSGATASDFEVTTNTLTSIEPNVDAPSFTVSPKPGLLAGSVSTTYIETVTVSAASGNTNPIESQSINVSFTVKKRYTVTFDPNGGSFASDDGLFDETGNNLVKKVWHGETVTAPNAPTRTGDYVFGWWYEDEEDETTPFNFETTQITGPLDLYAHWIPPHTVTFNWNYEGAPDLAPQTVPHNTAVTPPASSPPMRDDNYVFGGWYWMNEDVDTLWNFDTDTVTDNLDLYANWIAPHTVTFNLNCTGATGAPEAQTVVHNETATEPTTVPTWTVYDFAGWYTEETCETEWDFDDPVTGNLTLYANWNPHTFAAAITYMAMTADSPSASYTLQSGSEGYNPATAVTLTAGTANANSPASVIIDGSGRTVTGNNSYIPLTVGEGVTLKLKNMTFSQIPFKVAAGGTLVLDDGSVIRGNRQHAAPANASNVSQVTGQFDGTGVYVDGGSLVMEDGSLITDNNHSGVQVFNSGDISGSFTMSGGKISGNIFANARWSGVAGWNGAGVGIFKSSFTMTGGEISGNTAPMYSTVSVGYGGGVAVYGSGAVFNMSGGKISGNTAAYSGGGVCLWSGATFNMSGTAEISGNTATSSTGGGVDMWINTAFTMAGGVIKSNRAGGEGGGVYASGDGNTRFTMTGGTIGGPNPGTGTGNDYGDGNVSGANGGGVYLSNYTGASMSGNPTVISRAGAVNGVLNGVNGQLIEDQIYANPPAYTTNTEVYALLNSYTGGNGSAIIEGYTNGEGPELIQNNYPRNVQFTLEQGHTNVFKNAAGQIIPPANPSTEGSWIYLPLRYIP